MAFRTPRTPLSRSTPLKRGKGMAKRSKARKSRRRRFEAHYGSEERVRWIQSLPCSVPGCRAWPSENAHVKAGGMGMKAAPEWITPLCKAHHDEQHRGSRTFEEKYGLDLEALARETDAKWRER